jgi:hypothetical protein
LLLKPGLDPDRLLVSGAELVAAAILACGGHRPDTAQASAHWACQRERRNQYWKSKVPDLRQANGSPIKALGVTRPGVKVHDFED